MSIFGIAPAPTTPQADPEAINALRNLTVFGAIKAVIGSSHPFRRKVREAVPVVGGKADKDGKPREIVIERDETFFRVVRSAHQFPAHQRRWICLGTELAADTEEDLLALIYATHGSPEAMRRAGKRLVYCAELLVEVDIHDSEGGRPIVRREQALVSDREPAP
jgi:hypothetical protein